MTAQEPFTDHKTGQACLPRNPPIRQNAKANVRSVGSRGANMLPWRKIRTRPKGILSKQQCGSSPNNNSLPSHTVQPWKAVNKQSPENPTDDSSMEGHSSRIHLSRSNDRLRACDCPYPEEGPLCAVPSLVTTVSGDDINAAPQRTNLSHRVLEWASGLEKQAMDIINYPSIFYAGAFNTYPDPNTSPRGHHLEKGDGVGHSTTTSSLGGGEPATIIQCSYTIATEEVFPSTIHRVPSRPVPVSQPPKDGPTSTPPLPRPPVPRKPNRIEALELKKEDLAQRRKSTEKAIYNLLWSPQPDSVLYDMHAREETKRTTTRLNSELASVRREEHEVGLSLLRALKSQDEKSCSGEGTSLWVSRFTR